MTDAHTDAAELDSLPTWHSPVAHYAGIGPVHLRELFACDAGPAERLL